MEYIPRDLLIWEAFHPGYNNNRSDEMTCQSAGYLRELGFRVVSIKCDFFESNFGDIIVSNIPFSLKKKVFERLKALNKPFIVIAPALTLHTSYVRELFGKSLSIIIPQRRIYFDKRNPLTNKIETTKRANFECCFYCYKVPSILPQRLLFSK